MVNLFGRRGFFLPQTGSVYRTKGVVGRANTSFCRNGFPVFDTHIIFSSLA